MGIFFIKATKMSSYKLNNHNQLAIFSPHYRAKMNYFALIQ